MSLFFILGFVRDNFLLIDSDELYQFDLSKKTLTPIPVKQRDTTMTWMKYDPIDKKIYWTNDHYIMQSSNLNGSNQELTDKTSGKFCLPHKPRRLSKELYIDRA